MAKAKTTKEMREIKEAVKDGARAQLAKLTEKIKAGKGSKDDIREAEVLAKQIKTGRA